MESLEMQSVCNCPVLRMISEFVVLVSINKMENVTYDLSLSRLQSGEWDSIVSCKILCTYSSVIIIHMELMYICGQNTGCGGGCGARSLTTSCWLCFEIIKSFVLYVLLCCAVLAILKYCYRLEFLQITPVSAYLLRQRDRSGLRTRQWRDTKPVCVRGRRRGERGCGLR